MLEFCYVIFPLIMRIVQYLPYESPYASIEPLTTMLPKLSYNIFFEKHTDEAIKELGADVRRTLRGTLRTMDSPTPDAFLRQKDSFLRGWDGVDEVRPWAEWQYK